MAPLMASVLSGCRDCNRFDAIVPIPLHRSRLAKRGFTQEELIAQGVTLRINAAVLDKLKVVRRTKDQSSSPPARRANVAGAFASRGTRGRRDSPPRRRRLPDGRHPERVRRGGTPKSGRWRDPRLDPVQDKFSGQQSAMGWVVDSEWRFAQISDSRKTDGLPARTGGESEPRS